MVIDFEDLLRTEEDIELARREALIQSQKADAAIGAFRRILQGYWAKQLRQVCLICPSHEYGVPCVLQTTSGPIEVLAIGVSVDPWLNAKLETRHRKKDGKWGKTIRYYDAKSAIANLKRGRLVSK